MNAGWVSAVVCLKRLKTYRRVPEPFNPAVKESRSPTMMARGYSRNERTTRVEREDEGVEDVVFDSTRCFPEKCELQFLWEADRKIVVRVCPGLTRMRHGPIMVSLGIPAVAIVEFQTHSACDYLL